MKSSNLRQRMGVGAQRLMLLLLLLGCPSHASSTTTTKLTTSSLRALEEDTANEEHDNSISQSKPSSSTTEVSTETSSSSSSNDPQQYSLWPPEKIKTTLMEWANYYPDLVRVTTAQDSFGLATAGTKSDCPYDNDVVGCKNYILHIQDFVKHPLSSESSNHLPEVFLSGELHGNERVGPTAVMETASLLLKAADCEAKPRHLESSTNQHSFNDKTTDWKSQLQAAKDCRKALAADGIDDVHRKWLARLVATRRIVIVPTANALGYYRNKREEDGIDPNRDFPYDVTHASDCMQTIAGRTLNELFRQSMFQLSLTFHGGMEVVGYEWGAPTWLGHLSPDDTAQAEIGSAYSRYGGGFATSKPYNYGTMNDLVYYVRGGFEDWAYAGSWDPDRVLPCEPKTFGGYDKSKTIYSNSTLRVFNMLIETSDNKIPKQNTLGTSFQVFDADTPGNGHVSRNIRLSLLAVDVVQPYVSFIGVNEVTLTEDVVPLVGQDEQPEDRSCQETKTILVPRNQQDVTIRWSVGGAFAIDQTELYFAKWDDVPADVLNCYEAPSDETVQQYFQKASLVGDSKGTGFFSKAGPSPRLDDSQKETMGPVFSATMDVSIFQPHDKLVVLASARVDQGWTKQPKDFQPKLPPQSHVVNARTNPNWRFTNGDKVIQGRLDWYSMPLTVMVGDYEESVGKMGGGPSVVTVEKSNRFGETFGEFTAHGVTPKTASASLSNPSMKGGPSNGGHPAIFGPLLGLCLLGVVGFFVYRRMRKPKRRNSGIFRQVGSGSRFCDDDDDEEEFEDEEEFGRYRDKSPKTKEQAAGKSRGAEVELTSS